MTMSGNAHGRQLEAVVTADNAAFADWLQVNQPERGARTAPLRGGQIVLTGRGLFVNAAMACGFDDAVDDADVDLVESMAAAVGVVPSVQISELTHPEVQPLLQRRAYTVDHSVACVVHDLADLATPPAKPLFDLTPVESPTDLVQWQEAAAIGWGHDEPGSRSASDAFAAAGHAMLTPGLFLVRDPDDGVIVGCTALSIRDGMAVLGGMSTVPGARNRGVQHVCIERRLQLALAAGCTVAAAQTDPVGGSLRNLRRAGFVHSHTTQHWVRHPGQGR